MATKQQTKKRKNQRPKELSNLIFWLPSKFGDILAGGDDTYLRKVRRLEKPVIYIEKARGSYPYQVLLDVVEGFSNPYVELTEGTVLDVREAFKSRKTTKRCLEQLDISRRVFCGNYKTVEDAVSVANLLSSINYGFYPLD
jgi:hypothetical protein